MFLVALTGNYGMGKSSVLSMFRKLGAATLDTDEIVESLIIEKKVLVKIRKLLGDNVFYKNGNLDKKKVAEIIFKDASLRYSLEDILHPLVFERIKDFIKKINVRYRVLMTAVPLVYERGYENRFDKIVVVYTREEVALDRLKKNRISKRDAILRLKAQLPIEEKMKKADFLINNNGSLDETATQVKKIYKKLMKEIEK
jgi:dephospho-CoA kinase